MKIYAWSLNLLFLAPMVIMNSNSFAKVGEENPCLPVFQACEDQGYTYDKVAQPGLAIWNDCASPIINDSQKVRGISLDSERLKACRSFKHGFDSWERGYQSKHSTPPKTN